MLCCRDADGLLVSGERLRVLTQTRVRVADVDVRPRVVRVYGDGLLVEFERRGPVALVRVPVALGDVRVRACARRVEEQGLYEQGESEDEAHEPRARGGRGPSHKV